MVYACKRIPKKLKSSEKFDKNKLFNKVKKSKMNEIYETFNILITLNSELSKQDFSEILNLLELTMDSFHKKVLLESSQQFAPFFSNSSELLSRFLVIWTKCCHQSSGSLSLGITRLAESFWCHLRVYSLLEECGYQNSNGDTVFIQYLDILDLCNESNLSNQEIQNQIQSLFDSQTDPSTSLKLTLSLKEEQILELFDGILFFTFDF